MASYRDTTPTTKDEDPSFKLHYRKESDLDWTLVQPSPEEQLARRVAISGFNGETVHGRDELNITPDVNAFAGLISSRELRPPLSIGLFGDWGSGKSFFMSKLRQSVDANVRIVKKEQEEAVQELLDLLSRASEDKEAVIQQIQQNYLPDPAKQAGQIKEWLKLPDAWAREILLKIYGNNSRQVDRQIRQMREYPEQATKELEQNIKSWQESKFANFIDTIISTYQNRESLAQQIITSTPSIIPEKRETLLQLMKEQPESAIEELEHQIRKNTQDDEHDERLRHLHHLRKTLNVVNKLAANKQEKSDDKSLRYCRYISQIEFNAWHFVDTNLWASLINHIFEALNRYVGNLSLEEQEYIQLYRTLENTQEMIKVKTAELDKVDEDIKVLQEELEAIEAEKFKEQQELQNIDAKDIWHVLKEQADVKAASGQIKGLLSNVRDQFGVNVASELGMENESQQLEKLVEAKKILQDFALAIPGSSVALVEKAPSLTEVQQAVSLFVNQLNSKAISDQAARASQHKDAGKLAQSIITARAALPEEVVVKEGADPRLESATTAIFNDDPDPSDEDWLTHYKKDISAQISHAERLKKIEWEKAWEPIDEQIAKNDWARTRQSLMEELQQLQGLAATLTAESDPTELRTSIKSSLDNIQQFIDHLDPIKQLDLSVKENRVKVEALVSSFSDSKVKTLEAFKAAKAMPRRKRQIFILIVILLILVLAVMPMVWDWEQDFGQYISARLIKLGAQLTGLAYTVLDLIPNFLARFRKGMKKLDLGVHILGQAQSQIHALEARATTELDAAIAAQNEKLAAKQKEQEEKRQSIRELKKKAEELRKDKRDIERGRRFSSFVEERLNSADYKKHLGLISIIRNDFEKLTNYLHHRGQHSRLVAQFEEAEVEQVDTIDRIILYIDDLDRCPPEKVVEVLQAIHLILAFPLFVVVVGVDVRWVSKSLIKKYGTMLAPVAPGNGHGSPNTHSATLDEGAELTLQYRNNATPFDYLEKIFQIPFRLQIMDDGAKKHYISKLLEGDLVVEEAVPLEADPPPPNETPIEPSEAVSEEPTEPEDTPDPPPSSEPTPIEEERVSPDETDPPPVEEPAEELPTELHPITLTQEEYDFIQYLSPILVGSPRTIKRFVNICRLIKSHDKWGSGEAIEESGLSEYLTLVFVLAIITGKPNLASQFFDWLGDNARYANSQPSAAPKQLKDFIAEKEQEKISDPNCQIAQLDETAAEEWMTLFGFLMEDAETTTPARQRFLRIRETPIQRIDELTGIAARFSFRFTRY